VAPQPYREVALQVLARTPVRQLLASRPAVVLERIARGAGRTCWYLCADACALDEVAGRLWPGSSVSFYFDGRIRDGVLSPELLAEIQRLTAKDIDIVFGVLAPDGIDIDVDYPSTPGEVADDAAHLTAGARAFFGLFPARDNDGVDAVTLNLPDADGVVRPHPH